MNTTPQDIEIINTTDMIFRQKNQDSPIEIWVDVLLADNIDMTKRNKCQASLADNLLCVQVSRGFARSIALDEESQKVLTHFGGVMVFCGPSGVLAEADLLLS